MLGDYRGHCGNTASEIVAAIRTIERRRDSYIRGLGQADSSSFAAGVISRFQEDIAALKSLRAFVLEEGARDEWEVRVAPNGGLVHEE